MKFINIITYNNQYGLSNDVKLLVTNLEKFYKDNVKFNFLNFFEYKCLPADINIFLETPSKLMFQYAPINILIPNQEWYYHTWIEYIDNFDFILTKTRYGYDIFKSLVKDKDKVHYMGWKSKDMYEDNIEKDYTKCFHLAGGSIYKHTQELIDNWNENLPELTVLYNPIKVKLVENRINNIKYITDMLKEDDLVKLMNQNGIHICCSETEGFGHYIQEAKSCKSIVLTTNAQPMKEFINDDNGFLIDIENSEPLEKTLGSKFNIKSKQLNDIINLIKSREEDYIEKKCNSARSSFLYDSRKFDTNMKKIFDKIFKSKKNHNDTIFFTDPIDDENLPKVSLITLTYNRRNFFKLALHNYKNLKYPKDKVEWIILDDGTDTILDMIPEGENIVYKYIGTKMDIGRKRNYGVELASNDIIAFMDDDDYYYPEHLKIRVNYLEKSNKKHNTSCVVCSTIGCFDINKYISIMNVPPHQLPFEDRVSEATLTFYKKFWEVQKFNDFSKGAEGNEFLKNRSDSCLEITWEGIICSLLHSSNTSTRVVRGNKPNGCHFGFDDDLFLFVTQLDDNCPEEDKKLVEEEIKILKAAKKKEVEDKIRKEAEDKIKKDKEKKEKDDEINELVDDEIQKISQNNR